MWAQSSVQVVQDTSLQFACLGYLEIIWLLFLCPQVIQDLALDELSCSALVPYTLPSNTTNLAASLTARILLALPGANGEPDYQSFDIQTLLPGQAGLQSR